MTDNELINKVFIQADYSTRTFESRLLFIKELFSHTFNKDVILGRCINHKLLGTYETYAEELEESTKILTQEKPEKVLKKL